MNRNYLNIEITANFLMADELPSDHYTFLYELIRNDLDRFTAKAHFF